MYDESMEEAIKNFPKQFSWEPVINGQKSNVKSQKFVVCGMGGSGLGGEIIKSALPAEDIVVHKNYGLPTISGEALKNSLVILSSHSGNTEEVLDSARIALWKKLNVAAVTTGGKLLKLARGHNLPFVVMPESGLEPRAALGYSVKALIKIMRFREPLREIGRTSRYLDVGEAQKIGKALARRLFGKIPIIYSSDKNLPTAYTWKIKFNETAKIPAFSNAFPELNHNEMMGLDKNFSVIFLEDKTDDPRIQKRVKITKKLLAGRGLSTSVVQFPTSSNVWYKIFQNLLIADWASYYLARRGKVDPEHVPMVEEFKKMMKQ